jgi:hypothetical protein
MLTIIVPDDALPREAADNATDATANDTTATATTTAPALRTVDPLHSLPYRRISILSRRNSATKHAVS